MVEATTLGVAAAFGAGLISFVSPCVLPLVPAYVSYIAGQSVSEEAPPGTRQRLTALSLSAFFVLGFSVVFVTLGASATFLGHLLLQYRYQANLLGGAIVIAFGALMLGMTRGMPWLQRDYRLHPRLIGGKPVPAFVLGVAFGFGWTPCIGPILGAILTLSAMQTSTVASMELLGAYAAGLGIPFLITAVFMREMAMRLKGLRRFGRVLQIAAGAIMVAMGIAMMTGKLAVFSYWLLEVFPVFGRLG